MTSLKDCGLIQFNALADENELVDVIEELWMGYRVSNERLLYFTMFNCDLTFSRCIKLQNDVSVYFVKCNTDKEQEFNQRLYPTFFTYHQTTDHCMYSICRNGIKSMSNEGQFCTNGATHGPGIYMWSYAPKVAAGGPVLCYAVSAK